MPFELYDAQLLRHGRPILGPLSWQMRPRGVTVILGPAGTGKSSLLLALANAADEHHLETLGTWRYRGRSLDAADVAIVPQKASAAAWERALRSGASTVLLDEPQPLDGRDHGPLAEAITGHRGAVLLVTHHLGLARSVADEVALFVAGRLHAVGAAPVFFDAPPSDLARRFLTQGNCWPAPAPPTLPSHFQWIDAPRLAGMGWPGLLGDQETDLVAIASAGVSMLVSLTEQPFDRETLRAVGIVGRHFPIVDMRVPAIGPTARLCRDIERAVASGEGVAVHCRAGLGRTGTVLAAYLVWCGTAPDAAIATLRGLRRGFIQTQQQERFVHQFAESV